MKEVLQKFLFLIGIIGIHSTLISDNGCTCALTKTATTAPNASASVVVGCSLKTDWNGLNTEWCLADQTSSPCGTFQTGFGWVDFCAEAGFPTVNIVAPPLIEWDQDNTTFYTGQNLNVTWTYKNILADEWVRVQYTGQNLRTLTSGSGTNITTGFFASRLSDSSNSVTSRKTPVNVNLPSTATISQNSMENITVIQSKLMNIQALDGNRTLGGGQNTVCDDRNLTVTWRGLGEAQFGVASVQLRRQTGFSGTQTLLSVSNVPVFANGTYKFICPRTTTPSSSNVYAFEISVQEPGGSAYTGTSPTFNVAQAPTPSNTPSPTPTPSKTSTPTPSTTPTPTSSSSSTRTPTPSITPSPSATPSTTETARPSIDYALIARNAADAVDTQTPVIGAVVGTLAGVIMLLGAYKYYMYVKLTEKRKRKQAITSKHIQEARALYGIHDPDEHEEKTAPSVVMYQVNIGKPMPKKEFQPVTRTKV